MVLFQNASVREYLKARVDFFTREILQTLVAKAFHGKRSHHSAVNKARFKSRD